ncbi:helix-turn-helix domain-containing protein [Streptomyces sp. NPDC051644]|uniref:helix-turn-helix domain-containing protein n=1 Tax=Streptomyces sp. NPDC051644 TaxID=3365666 RepID=UPI0037BDE43D
MSFDAITWALEHSPVTCPYERLILTCLARRANADGTDAYPSRRTLAAAGLADKSTVTRKLNALEKRGIIREGDQRAALRIPEHLRPKVYDLLIPFSYYSPDQLQRVNRERSDRGLKPLTPEARPDIAPAPERKHRSDKGKKRAPKKPVPSPAPEGGASSTPLDSSQFEGGASSTRVLEAPQGGASSTPKLSFNSVLSLPTDPAVPAEAGTDEREAAAPEGKNPAAGGGVPGPREEDGAERAELLVMLVGLPGTVSERAALPLVPLAVDALAAGWTLSGLRAYLAGRCDPDRVRYAPAVYEKHLRDLPPARPGRTDGSGGRPGMCERHPAFVAGDCSPCRRAEMDRQQRGTSEPGPVDGAGLLARVRAGMPVGGAQ